MGCSYGESQNLSVVEFEMFTSFPEEEEEEMEEEERADEELLKIVHSKAVQTDDIFRSVGQSLCNDHLSSSSS